MRALKGHGRALVSRRAPMVVCTWPLFAWRALRS